MRKRKTNSLNKVLKRLYTVAETYPNTDISRRLHKLGEELGEALQAYLSVTSTHNLKGKTWDDFHEELVDQWIILTHMLYSSEHLTEVQIANLVDKKIDKWLAKGDKDTVM